MAIHAAMVDAMDQEIGRVLSQLEAMNVLENTIVMFASDNGASAEIMVRDGGHDPEASPAAPLPIFAWARDFPTLVTLPFGVTRLGFTRVGSARL